jgi:putative CocE/NonD family hydrolase
VVNPRASVIVDRDVAVPMRDGVVLRADVWRPASEGRYPVLLLRTPYDKSATEVTNVHSGLDALRAVDEGFVVVIQDTRGRFQSEGIFDPYRCEPLDGADTVSWAAGLPFANGNVGMYGGSYFGGTQLLAAMEAPPALKAIAPAITAADYFEGWTYQSGVLQLGFVLYWTLFALSPNEILRQPPRERGRYQLIFDDLMADPWATLARLPLDDLDGLEEILPWYREWLAHGERDEFWLAVAPNEHYGRMTVPALHVGGWYDIFVAGTIENFIRLSEEAATPEARAGQRLLVGPWSHANYRDTVGGLQFGPASSWAALDSTGMQLAFFGEHLRGDAPAELARVRVFLMGANAWIESDSWPLPDVHDQRWNLRGGGVLSAEPAGDEAPDTFTYDPASPVPTQGGATFIPGFEVGFRTGAHDQREVEDRDDVLVYTSAPLVENIDVVGHVVAGLCVSSSAPSTDFTAKLVDVHPDGRAYVICDGIATFADIGGPQMLNVSLGPTANRFRSGHRIRLEVSSSNFPRFARNPNTGASRVSATDTDLRTARQAVYHDASRSSFLQVPVRR